MRSLPLAEWRRQRALITLPQATCIGSGPAMANDLYDVMDLKALRGDAHLTTPLWGLLELVGSDV